MKTSILSALTWCIVSASWVKVPFGNGISWENKAYPIAGQKTEDNPIKPYFFAEVDLDNDKDLISSLKKDGHIVFCYFSVGSLEGWRPDAGCDISGGTIKSCDHNEETWKDLGLGGLFSLSAEANSSQSTTDKWHEVYLDIRKFDKLTGIMEPRFKKAKQYGCHGVEPDNIDCFENNHCFTGSGAKSLQIKYNEWQVKTAHDLGLAIAMKNGDGLVKDSSWSPTSLYDLAILEQKQDFSKFSEFKNKDKAILVQTYDGNKNCKNSEYSLNTCDGNGDDCDEGKKIEHCIEDSSFPTITCSEGSYDSITHTCGGSSPTRRRADPTRRRADPTRRRADPTRRRADPTRRRADPTRRRADPTRRRSPARRRSSPSGWCTDGIFKDQSGVGVCCAKACNMCGGTGCGSAPGGKWDCCADAIAQDGEDCKKPDDTGCRIPSSSPTRRRSSPTRRRSSPTRRRSSPSSWCTDGIFKDQSGVGVCCAKACNMCGGTGCGSAPGGKWDCCADAIAKEGEDCKKPDDTGCRIPDLINV